MFRDIRYGLRSLRQNPGFALVAILSLALGIGVNAAIFSLADAVVLRPLPVPHPGQLVALTGYKAGNQIGGLAIPSALSYLDYRDFRARNRSYLDLAGFRYNSFGFASGKNSLPEAKFGLLVTGNFFDVLGVAPELGRRIRPEEDQVRGRDAVAVISHDLWVKEFDSSREVVGRTIYLGGIPFTVIGVLPESFTGVDQYTRPALYVPLMMSPRLAADPQHDSLDDRADHGVNVRGRLKPGVTVAAASAEAKVIARQLEQAYPATNRHWSAAVETQFERRVHQSPPDAILVAFMLALAGIVLLIACANVANLILSRGRARAREIAIRVAIGAGRGRLVRQLLTESLLIGLLGGACGLLIAQVGASAFSSLRVPSEVPIVIDARLDPRVLLFSLAASLLSVVLFGLVPAWQATKTDLVPALKSAAGGQGRNTRLLGRNTLVVAQVAGSLVLLVAATQLYLGTRVLFSSSPGFRTDKLIMASFQPALVRYTPAQTVDFYRRLIEKARALPGVKSAALAQSLPMSNLNSSQTVIPEGVDLPRGAESVTVMDNTVSDGYFATIGMPIVRGRGFLPTDTAETPNVAVVNEQFQKKYYPTAGAVGKRFRLEGRDRPWIQIVGVAKQSKYVFIAEPPIEAIYFPLRQRPQAGMVLIAESYGAPGALAAPLRETVRSLDADMPMFGVRTMAEYFDQRATQVLNLISRTFGSMALLGLILALLGLYGLMTYSVTRRTREIGIRMAIGADHLKVTGMVLRQGLVLAGIGVVLGVTFSLLLSQALTRSLRLPPFNIAMIAAATAGLLLVAALGAYLPARRASLVDPLKVLRQE
jgi:predicted permease